MEKRYYFRGLGLGIIVTALIMGIAVSRGEKREMTNAEIIARAKELGMTENTTLLGPTEEEENPEAEPSAEAEQAQEPVKKDVAVAQPKEEVTTPAREETEPTDGGETSPAEKPDAGAETAAEESASDKKPAADTNEMTKPDDDAEQGASAAEETPEPEEPAQQQTSSAASITIVSGDGSFTVAKKLEEAGVVSSASLYDDFLCRNGYDKRLRTGTFQIPAGASDDEIAKIVTSQP
ncbi:MAG: endolytic transglycosylase MltG [Bacteroidales bacterium]|nr:endolytic transglycosylase MltG [Bacteroidales bacterium]MCM1415597.1 endolytic transglycosylase MltG [bacterium]MCM1422990.1 endolytic transglycosylase MltG [bacterium]